MLDYTVPLEAVDGACNFRLPLFSDLEPIRDFCLSGVIAAGVRPKDAASLSHPAMAFQSRADGAIGFELTEDDYQPQSDFLLSFRQAAQRQVAVRSYTADSLPTPNENGQNGVSGPLFGRRAMYFQASIPPGVRDAHPTGSPARDETAEPPADVLVLADTSSSMRNNPLLRQSLGMVLHGLRSADRFRLVCVDVAARPLGAAWLPAGGPEVETALAQYDRQFPLGGTDLSKSLREAVGAFNATASGRRRLIVYVGDGENTMGNAAALAKELGDCVRDAQACFFGVTVSHGKQTDRPERTPAAFSPSGTTASRDNDGRGLLDSVARASGGLVFDLVGANLGQHDLFGWLLAGLPRPVKIVKVEVEGADPADLYFPTAWIPDRNLDIFGRISPREKLRLNLTTLHDGKPVTQHWELAAGPQQDDVFVGRLWAQRKLDELRRQQPAQVPQIVALSQEWSLLSPYTAFLVLENDEAYAQWQIDRRQRHRYWKPSDARPETPLSPEWMARAADRTKSFAIEAQQQILARLIRSARAAIEEGHPALAVRLLASMPKSPVADKSLEYGELRRQANAAMEREALLRSIDPVRTLMDPLVQSALPSMEPCVLPLVAMTPLVGPDFLRQHPYSRQLLREVDVAPRPRTDPNADGKTSGSAARPNDNWFQPSRARTSEDSARRTATAGKREARSHEKGDFFLQDLATMLGGDASMNVIIDERALDDCSIRVDMPIKVYGHGRMSLRNYARFILSQIDLTLEEEPHRLLITSRDEAESRITTEVYPIADLLSTDRVADRGLLADPYMDCEEAARARICAKLQRPTSMTFREKPLREVVDEFAKALDDTVLVDGRALEDAGIGLDVPVTAAWRDVPIRESLRWILRDAELTYVVRNEALIITTPDQAEGQPEVRLHSARGVLYEYPVPANDSLSPGMGGMGGMGGGMGGGLFGGGGSFGGGFFGGGSFGGMGGGMGGAIASDPNAGKMSTGGDSEAVEEPQPDVAEASQTVSPRQRSAEAVSPAGPLPEQREEQQYACDADSIVNTVTNTVKPQSWDGVGGPGSMCLFEPTLDLVINATGDVHEEIDVLLDRLRKLPPVVGTKAGWRPARAHPLGSEDDGWDFDSVIDMVTTTVLPQQWDEVGGSGSIAPDEPRAALVVSQTQDARDAVQRLLVMLRRSRYESLRSDRPWQFAAPTAERPLIAPLTSTDALPVRLSALPEPKPEELAALRARRVPESGVWEWSRLKPDLSSSNMVVRCQGRRLEIRLPDCVLRAEGDAGAIAWPGLGLVELGNWGESVRQLADRLLPWLPHRTNDELARLFEVSKVADGRLRLIPPGLPASANTWLEVEFSEHAELPRLWQSHLLGKLAGQLRFHDSTTLPVTPTGGRVSVLLEDGAGKNLAFWTSSDARKQPLPAVTIPALEAGWDGYVRLDWRSKEPAVDRPVREALEAIGRSDWPTAISRLGEATKIQPRHPLLLLLTAWCHDRDPRSDHREQVVVLLKETARRGSSLLTRFVAEGNFRSLSSAERYAVLMSQPIEHLKSAADWDCLARAATEVGKLDEALEHARAAVSRGGDSRQFERRYVVVELLLRLEKAGEAVEMAKQWAADAKPTFEALATMAELLAKYGRRPTADELLVRALATKNLAPLQRFGLMCRRAVIHDGQERWRMLMDAAEIVPTDSPGRRQCLEMILADVNAPSQAEVAGQLAGQTQDPRFKAGLLLRQADLSESLQTRADLDWQVYQAGQLPQDRFYSAYALWNHTKQHKRVIEAAEERLRSGKPLARQTELQELEMAYRAVGRHHDAARAATSDPEPPAKESSPPRRNRGASTGKF